MPAGVVELQERRGDVEEGAGLLAAKQRRPSARSYLDFQAGSDANSDSSSNYGDPPLPATSPLNSPWGELLKSNNQPEQQERYIQVASAYAAGDHSPVCRVYKG